MAAPRAPGGFDGLEWLDSSGKPSPLTASGSNIPAVTLNVADESLVSARGLHDLAFRMTDGAEESVAMFVSDAISASAPASPYRSGAHGVRRHV